MYARHLSCVVALLGWGALTPQLRADVLMPGHRPIEHRAVIQANPAFDSFEWWAFPVRGFGGAIHIEPGVAFEFSSKYGTRIYALPKGTPPSALQTREYFAAFPSAAIPVAEEASVPVLSTLESVESELALQMGPGTEFTLTHRSDRRQRNTSLVLAWCASIAIAALGLIWFWKRRSR